MYGTAKQTITHPVSHKFQFIVLRERKTMIKACIFDLDGTLLDTLDTILYYVNTTFQKYSLPKVDKAKCKSAVGKGALNLLTRLYEDAGFSDKELFDRLFRDYNLAYDADPMYLTKPYDGIIELLDLLYDKGIKLAVLSNKPEISTRLVISHYFGDRFEFVAGGKAGVALKPAPEAIDRVLDSLGVTLDECAYVGDSEVDVIFANNIKPALPIAVSWGFRTPEQLKAVGADIILDSVDKLSSCLISKL